MENKEKGQYLIKSASIVLLLLSIAFIIFDIILTKGILAGGVSAQGDNILMWLSYGVTAVSIVASVIGFMSSEMESGNISVALGIILLLLGMGLVIYQQLIVDQFNYVAFTMAMLGFSYVNGGMKINAK